MQIQKPKTKCVVEGIRRTLGQKQNVATVVGALICEQRFVCSGLQLQEQMQARKRDAEQVSHAPYSSCRHNPFYLIGWGLTVWTVAVGACGFTVGFWSLTFCRMFVGVGEASFVSLAAPFIDDNAPHSQVSFQFDSKKRCFTGYIAPVEIGFLLHGRRDANL
jgi:hypothetical protein